MAYLAALTLAAYLGLLIWRSARRKPGFATWHMFAGVKTSSFSLHSRSSGAELNIWDFLPHTQLNMSNQEVRLFLYYLARVHGMNDLCGTVDVREDMKTFQLIVEESRVVD
ncbi:hypothetical protein QQY24_34580 [Streptomyces sp. TG1A-8]|uniref:hypothetical protein n=1 Tax=Streptomyces sp. TG1A-8 TaxID=3051385 RepID=UPI00265BC230|nr:hypothetical protein [Streptomyces sp. TG1A-8]MDO0929769.1 hypothetical protein [Streptomyces sp. TG1A-8]MDO0930180.1 hypothetical protein [Streptomyces sp. TG1A-8]